MPAEHPRPTPLTPEQEARVRRALAAARHEEPVPSDVAARLDDTLAGLVATRGEPEPAEPASLASRRRRRRRFAAALGVAAAVVVGGLGVAQVLPQGGVMDAGSDGAFPTTESLQSDRDASGGMDSGLRSESQRDSSESKARSPRERRGELSADSSVPLSAAYAAPRVDPDHFARDVRRAVRLRVDRLSLEDTYDPQAGTLDRRAARRLSCAVGDVGRGRLLHVRYAEEPALLVLRRPDGLLRRVDLYECGASEPLRTTYLVPDRP